MLQHVLLQPCTFGGPIPWYEPTDNARDPDGNTVFQVHGFDVFEDGFMDPKYDLENLESYLRVLEIMPKDATLVRGN